jgi:hypothetical protein
VLTFEYDSSVAADRWRDDPRLIPASAYVERVEIAPPLSNAAD